ncbi:Fc.00g093780.m01.CDS01 [Cosmosporella sp. VM-42]
MLRRKETLTIITPIPGFIPRQLAIDILHSHSEVITLNPLVLSHKPIPAPRNAAADEYYSTWYEITERIQYVPGMGKAGSGKIQFNGCFHDMPWGLQTHIYAPLNIDMRNRYRVQGNQPGIEAPEPAEIGLEQLGAPKDGLYLREDIEIKCNITMMSFVKAEMKRASKEMVGRMIKKAELLDAGILKAMFDGGRLRTFNPADRSNSIAQNLASQPPPPPQQGYGPSPGSPQPAPSQPQQPPSYPQYSRPNTGSSQGTHQQNPYATHQTPPPQQNLAPPVPPKAQQSFAMELPGDYYYNDPKRSPSVHHSQPSPAYAPNQYRLSAQSAQSSDPRWSNNPGSPNLSDPQRTSMSSMASSHGGLSSPGMGHPGFAVELPSHSETTEEHRMDRKW